MQSSSGIPQAGSSIPILPDTSQRCPFQLWPTTLLSISRIRQTFSTSASIVVLMLATLLMPRAASAQGRADVVATIDGQTITLADVDTTIASQVIPIQQQLFALRKSALENLITKAVLQNEAARRGISVEELRERLTEGPIEVTRDQVQELYQQNAAAFAAMSSDEALQRLRLDLESQARMRNYRNALSALRAGMKVDLFLNEPRLAVAADEVTPANGPSDAAVTIVEFSDFQCPYCRAAQPVLKQILANYAKEVRLVFKELPLDIHDRAFASARAATCAATEGLFWQFHDGLFQASDLSPAALEKLAENLGLDLEKFRACMANDASRAAVMKDLQEAKRLGINATPTFIVNGRLVSGSLSYASFKEIIEDEIRSGRIKSGSTQTSQK